MRCVLYADNSLPLAIDLLSGVLNTICQSIKFFPGEEALRIEEHQLSHPDSYQRLSGSVRKEAERYDLAFLCTNTPFDDNFFFHSGQQALLVSFKGWNLLTDLPITNGLAYFIASVLCDHYEIGETHHGNTGCVNDFWWNKRGVNVGMRAAFICEKCISPWSGNPQVASDVQAILDAVCSASRQGKDILTFSPRPSPKQEHFDVFLCHNSAEKPAVREINGALQSQGIATWLDEEQLKPGLPWQPLLEKQISLVRAACVLVGESGLGPWQDMELRAFLAEFVNRDCPVIPVILPTAKNVPELPLFLRQMTWVDLRKGDRQSFERLVNALK